jgi:hypothetical protein
MDEVEDNRSNLVTDGEISEETFNSPAKKKQRGMTENIGLQMNPSQDRISSKNTIQEPLSRKIIGNERNTTL